jgi:hypothetical protein
MKIHRRALLLLPLSLLVLAGGSCLGAKYDEETRPWEVLFDGTSTDAWRGFKRDGMPEGWEVIDGALVRTGGGGDIITREEYGEFVLSFEWKVTEGANSGVFFHVSEKAGATYETGPEYQILDNALHADGGDARTSAAANYGLHAPVGDFTRPVGEWNEGQIIVQDGGRVHHWLNGRIVVEYELWTPEWEELVKASKFDAWKGYGVQERGHIALQDHGDQVAYRNIRIRRLD